MNELMDIEKLFNDLHNTIRNQYLVNLDMCFSVKDNENIIRLDMIKIEKAYRLKGIGTNIMNRICMFADENNCKVFATPTNEFGSSITRLRRFYTRFKFKSNKGVNKDFRFSYSMVRNPLKK